MKQKDIYWVDLNPIKGSEQNGQRPAVIISGNTMNDNLDIVIICPLSSKIKNYATCVPLKTNNLNNLPHNSEIIPFQIRTVSKKRLVQKIGEVNNDELNKLIENLNDIFNL